MDSYMDLMVVELIVPAAILGGFFVVTTVAYEVGGRIWAKLTGRTHASIL